MADQLENYIAKSQTSDYRDDTHHVWGPEGHVAECDTRELAEKIAKALNMYTTAKKIVDQIFSAEQNEGS